MYIYIYIYKYIYMYIHITDNKEPAGQPLDSEARKVWPWWKLKKWAAKIISHFIQRYGNPRYAGSDVEVFANYFKSHIASGIYIHIYI
jgi:hypothetical protein